MKKAQRDFGRSPPEITLWIRKSIFVCILFTSLLFIGCKHSKVTSRQAMVHETGSHVMPFDLGVTQHIFNMTEDGGIQSVLADNDTESDQILLIRQHLLQESVQFQSGDFSDPASLHGSTMPGIEELSKGIAEIDIQYKEVPGGAQIIFQTEDLHLITEIHRWFGAQLSDHGPDATSQ